MGISVMPAANSGEPQTAKISGPDHLMDGAEQLVVSKLQELRETKGSKGGNKWENSKWDNWGGGRSDWGQQDSSSSGGRQDNWNSLPWNKNKSSSPQDAPQFSMPEQAPPQFGMPPGMPPPGGMTGPGSDPAAS